VLGGTAKSAVPILSYLILSYPIRSDPILSDPIRSVRMRILAHAHARACAALIGLGVAIQGSRCGGTIAWP
jgi:hypothetical protein